MSTTTETATAATEAPATGTTPVAGAGEEFARLAPATLEVGPNVRDEVDTASAEYRALVASITEHVVLQAITASATATPWSSSTDSNGFLLRSKPESRRCRC